MVTFDRLSLRIEQQTIRLGFDHYGQNVIRYEAIKNNQEDDVEMEKKSNLILTGWGYAEYVASAAVALKALDGKADVYGMSRRRLPEFLEELATGRGTPHWKRIYLLGLSLSGNPESLKVALAKLKAKGVEVTWISALEMPEHIAELLEGVLDDRSRVPRDRAADVRAYFTLIDTAQFYYRNYQDESLYATTARYLANGVRPAA